MGLAGFKSIPLPLLQLSLSAVLKCGQSFRWSVLTPLASQEVSLGPNVEYRLCLRDRVICLRQSSDALFYRSVFPGPQPSPSKLLEREAETLIWLNDYFQLNIDLVSLYKQWAEKDKAFASFQERFQGIRILRQDPWENLISFICSSNNNISRITKMVQSLCTQYSPMLLTLEHPFCATELLTYHPFPPPSALADASTGLKLRSLGFGYRADFIQKTAKMLVDAHGTEAPSSPTQIIEPSEVWLQQLRRLSTSDAREELLKFVGVGRKVADCILLMSLDKKEVVPVDTHVHQIAMKYYGLKSSTGGKTNMTAKLYEEINTKLFSIWGEYAGWAHTVLFTADLKSFSSYGLPTPSPSPASMPLKKKGSNAVEAKVAYPTPSVTTSDSPLKRKQRSALLSLDEEGPNVNIVLQLPEENLDFLSLIDRVKRRRRS
ncbi:N-glycosylase/DNA lyase [Gymnopilus junonius]|uniref:DNA-(apurinic or apyrimidinic site) lyase n=1 Tax=Gymnopilus junonius TaxID=109634 RepID=A0A9P5TTU0_GYMJU|nr:N-glycosylase/DNA lyase [Gymnopilus junonius]